MFVFQYYFCTSIFLYFFAKSDLDLSIVFVFILYLSYYSFAKYYVLDRGGGQGRNKQKRYKFRHTRGVTTDLLDV